MQQTVPQQTQATESQNKNGASVDVQASNTVLAGSPFGEGNGGAEKKVNLSFVQQKKERKEKKRTYSVI
jgi:hypothetical protein